MSSNPVVLFVDDDPSILRSFQRVLRNESFDVLTAGNADEAFEILAEEPVAIVVSDLNMPGISGVELLQEVANRKPHAGRVLISGNADLPSLAEAVNRGQVTYYFEKPWSDDNLRLALRELVERHQLQERNERLMETIQAQNEALLEQSEIQHRFFAMMSHELRTPLNGIVGMLEILQRRVTATEDEKVIRTAVASAHHLTQLVNDVLDFSKIEAGEFELSSQAFCLSSLLAEVSGLLQPLAEEKGLTFQTTGIEPAKQLWLQGDQVRLRQVLINLVGNAIKFTDSGSVSVSLDRCEDGAQQLRIQDTGIGIPEDQIPFLFEAYRQVNAAKQSGGTGLGLSIAKQLVELMAGQLNVASKPDEGTVFTIELPLAFAEEHPATAGDEPEKAINSLSGRHYLVVDDNPTNRLIVKSLLEELGAEVAEADSGESALALLRRARVEYSMIFMDISLGGMDGIETLQRIRQDTLIDTSVPVIAMSAHVQPEEQARFLASGMSGFLGKPFTRRSLLACVGEYSIHTGESTEPTPTEGQQETQAVKVDPDVYGGLAAGVGEAAMHKLVESFCNDSLARAATIRDAEARADWETIIKEAHTLGSSAGMFGAVSLFETCRALEAAGKQGEMSLLPGLTTQLLSAIEPSVQAVRSLEP